MAFSSITVKDGPVSVTEMGTVTYVTQYAAYYEIRCRISIQVGSSVSVVISQNGSTLQTSPAPTSTQNHIDLIQLVNCAQGDSLAVALSSSSSADTLPNDVKSVIVFNRIMTP